MSFSEPTYYLLGAILGTGIGLSTSTIATSIRGRDARALAKWAMRATPAISAEDGKTYHRTHGNIEVLYHDRDANGLTRSCRDGLTVIIHDDGRRVSVTDEGLDGLERFDIGLNDKAFFEDSRTNVLAEDTAADYLREARETIEGKR